MVNVNTVNKAFNPAGPLQCGHGSIVVVNYARPVEFFEFVRLQCGHGSIVVVNYW